MKTVEGLLLVNKPPGVTSHDVVQVARRKLAIRQIGHTGTLDPIAEGLLILLVGRSTKHQQVFQRHEKLYETRIRLGVQTDTGDATGTVVRTAPIPVLARDQILTVLNSLRGPLTQTPPAYSAVKVKGRPAYWWTRRHQTVVLSPRVVHVAEIALVACTPETITFRVTCSAGTYIRSMAELIAERLGTVGHVEYLVRQGIGRWRLEDAKPLSWVQQATPELLAQHMRPCAS